MVNNVLGFPFIFRGALDCRATQINEAMKLAASKALADLAKEDVPDSVARAYGVEGFKFGREYLIPKPFDWRVLLYVAPAVAAAAAATGVAKQPIKDLEAYRRKLEGMLSRSRSFMQVIHEKAKSQPEAGRPRRGRPPEDPARRQDPRRGGDRDRRSSSRAGRRPRRR